MGYCRTLNGEGNRRIRRYVENGGVYIGFCAGGYYGSKRCEFEVGNKVLEVVGARELAFFPGIDRGCAFPGFVYHSEKGAKAVELRVNKSILSTGTVPNVFRSYYNGGGVFVDASNFADQGIEVLAEYTENLAVDSGNGKAAVVHCKVGEGAALLTGPHPEFVFLGRPADDWALTKPRFAAVNLEKKEAVPEFSDVIDILAGDEKHRMDFLKACLTKLGLEISEEQNVPSLSRIHLSSSTPSDTAPIVSKLDEVVTKDEHGEHYLKDENDMFHLIRPSTWKMSNLAKALPGEEEEPKDTPEQSDGTTDRIIDYNTLIKHLLIHFDEYPLSKETPYFNHHAFFANLKSYHDLNSKTTFGTPLLYGEVVTSTNTLLEKNTQLLRRLPTGTTFTATVQVAGRGRGSNIWVSPPGSLMFSTVIRHPIALMKSAPVVFVQYLAAMAVVQGVQTYDGTKYANVPIKLKWPNDIYADDPAYKDKDDGNSKSKESGGNDLRKYTKIGGILVNSHYNSAEYIAVCGIGLNTSNPSPTTSLNSLLPKHLAPFTIERLLARILTCFEELYDRFCAVGFDQSFEELYYRDWLHMGQVVTLETEGGIKARIRGITRDYGLLVAEEVVEDSLRGGWKGTGRTLQLQSDSNSFDFFRGLVRRKV